MKRCAQCQTIKGADEFHKNKAKKDGLSTECKPCARHNTKKAEKRYTQLHTEDWYMNVDKSTLKKCATCKQHFMLCHFYPKADASCGFVSYCKKCGVEKSMKYIKSSPERKLANSIRVRLWNGLKEQKVKKSNKTSSLVGCTWAVLVSHLESQFTSGMTWENHGQWHVDHIIPLSSVDLSDPEQLAKVTHYTNLQPLWKFDNLSKGAKLTCS